MDSLEGLITVIYARFSSDNQKDTSIDDQVALCRTHLTRHGGHVKDENILTDYAISGTQRARQGFDRLLKLVEAKAVNLVVTESGDRLTRDLGDADRLWKTCEFNAVRLICASDGIDSARDGARMAFRFKAVMADEFLVDLGKKTLRGLRGAAARGTSTGGLPYGYTSRPIWKGNREPDGYEILIEPDQAAVVVRAFKMYRDGHSFLTIATTLNNAGVPPPRFKSKRHPTKFWKKGTVREMLQNPAYAGIWSFGKKKWRKDPVSRKRRYTKRAPDDVQVTDRPHLRIVPQNLWDAVKARRAEVREHYSGRGEGAAGHRITAPFSGLLFCGVCGHRMINNGGSTSRAYKCSAATTGNACTNQRRLRQEDLVPAAVRELRRVLLQTDLHDKLREKIRARLKTFRMRADDERPKLERAMVKLDAEMNRLVTFIRSTDATTNPGAYEIVRTSLEEATAEQRDLQAKLDALKTRTVEPRLPTEEEILAYVVDVEARIQDDPTSAREALRRLLLDGKLIMHPQPDGSWRGESAVFPLRLAGRTTKPRSGGPNGASGQEVEIGGCAGRI
jgi:DNA invertase Pin-like site-specific DNA recombinase